MMTKAYNALSVVQMLFIDMKLRPTGSRDIFAFYVKGKLFLFGGFISSLSMIPGKHTVSLSIKKAQDLSDSITIGKAGLGRQHLSQFIRWDYRGADKGSALPAGGVESINLAMFRRV